MKEQKLSKEDIERLIQLNNEMKFIRLVSIKDKKKAVLKMMRDGMEKPNSFSSIYVAYTHWMNPKQLGYDPVFAEAARKIKNNKFLYKAHDGKLAKMEQLKALAASGGKRPSYRSSLGMLFSQLTSPDSKRYDAKFTKEMKRIAPHWFEKEIDAGTKPILLKMALNGSVCPTGRLKKDLVKYTDEASPYFHASFRRKIRGMQPTWLK